MRSWQLLKASWSVLRSGKGLVLFPILAGLVNVVVAVSFLAPAVAVSWDSIDQNSTVEPASYVLLGLFYLVTAYVTIFFNAALISQADVALSGGRPSVAAGLKVAGANWARILPWALLSATVSVVLRAIEERLGFVGRLIIGVIGIAWTTVTFLVLPVLVIERIGVGKAVKRSGELFKRTWGENMTGNVGLALIGLIAFLPTIALVALGIYAGGATLFACWALAVAWTLLVIAVMTAMSGIFQTALYRYAATQDAGFAGFDLSQAFRARR